MAESSGVDLPPRMKSPGIGNRWLGVTPIARAAVIGDVLVQLVSLERHNNGAILTVRISRLEENTLTEPVGGLPWPKLVIEASDIAGTAYRIDGGPGIGSE